MVLLSSIALVAASLVLTYSVVIRYFLHISTDWQDETAVFLIVGAVFMSAARLRRGAATSPSRPSSACCRRGRTASALLMVDIASLAFCAFFAWKSWTLLHEAWVDENYHSGSTWGPPLWIPYSLMTVGMTLLSLQLLLQIVAQSRGAGAPRMTCCRSACSTARRRCW